MDRFTLRQLSSALLIVFLLAGSRTSAQKIRKADKQVISNLQKHIGFLADDKLEGRRAGTPGEKLAMEYISNEFQLIGLLPKGTGTDYYQSFNIADGRTYEKSFLIINSDHISADNFFPFPASPAKQLEELPSIALRESGVTWFFNIGEDLQTNASNPHFDLADLIVSKAKAAAKKGATAMILYNLSSIEDNLVYNRKEKAEVLPIPVLFVSKKVAKKYFTDETAAIDLKLKVEFTEKNRTGHNVIGFIDNAAAGTIILGAHFDHLGYGEDGNSMLRTGEKLIHNGADDNASGTAALIELARALKTSRHKHHYNYLFIAFSGEELGLFGSKYFTDHPTVELARVDYMINMDMVGRLSDSSRSVTIGGYGTSPAWSELLNKLPESKNFNIKIDSSGSGPSDHTSFYRKDIPVLFFFTGLHKDYHKPTDDADKINYVGEFRIIKFIGELVNETDNRPKLEFTKTRDQQAGSSTRFSVTMGIMPDYTYSGRGIRVDGISDGRPAQKAGLMAGDVVIRLGDFPVNSMDNYMQALGKFKKGDKTVVHVQRGAEEKTFDIQF